MICNLECQLLISGLSAFPDCWLAKLIFDDYVLVENEKRIRRRASILARGRLRRRRALTGQAEPRFCAVTPELG